MAPPSRVLLLTREGCHLCVEAEERLRATCEELGVGWRAVDIDTDENLRTRFTDHVPVTYVDRNLLSYWFLDDAALRAALNASAPQTTSEHWLP